MSQLIWPKRCCKLFLFLDIVSFLVMVFKQESFGNQNDMKMTSNESKQNNTLIISNGRISLLTYNPQSLIPSLVSRSSHAILPEIYANVLGVSSSRSVRGNAHFGNVQEASRYRSGPTLPLQVV